MLLAGRDRTRELVPVKRATVVRDFYALHGDDGELDQGLEFAWGPIETVGARVARSMLAGDFPPSPDDRLEFSGFLAAQVVRGEGFRMVWERMNAAHGVHPLRNFTLHTTIQGPAPVGQRVPADAVAAMPLDRSRCCSPAISRSSYWRRGTSPRFFEGIGPMTAHEVRFALDPHHMLVLTWEGAAEDERIFEPEATIAVRLNAFTARWCEHELYCRPDLEALAPRTDPVQARSRFRSTPRTQMRSSPASSSCRTGGRRQKSPKRRDWGEPAEGYGLRHGRKVRR